MGLFSLDEYKKDKELADDIVDWAKGKKSTEEIDKKWGVEKTKEKEGSSSWW